MCLWRIWRKIVTFFFSDGYFGGNLDNIRFWKLNDTLWWKMRIFSMELIVKKSRWWQYYFAIRVKKYLFSALFWYQNYYLTRYLCWPNRPPKIASSLCKWMGRGFSVVRSYKSTGTLTLLKRALNYLRRADAHNQAINSVLNDRNKEFTYC